MDLSLCIVSYNCRELLRDCLTTLQEGVGDLDHEAIIVDNRSHDDTVAMLRADFPHVRCLANTENVGFAAATNQAMEMASGDVLLMLNPDTAVCAGALAELAGFLASHPAAGAAGARLVGPDGCRQSTCHPFPTLRSTLIAQLGLHRVFPRSRAFGAYDLTWWDHRTPRRVDWVSGACLAVERTAWEAVGPLDEGYFMYSEEVDWCYRLQQTGFECWYVPSAVVTHHEAGTWASLRRERILASHRSNFRFFGKNYGHASEVALRLLIATGALLRMARWSVRPPLPARASSVIADTATHRAVAMLALRFEETCSRSSRPTSA